jgi:hypothetical protein
MRDLPHRVTCRAARPPSVGPGAPRVPSPRRDPQDGGTRCPRCRHPAFDDDARLRRHGDGGTRLGRGDRRRRARQRLGVRNPDVRERDLDGDRPDRRPVARSGRRPACRPGAPDRAPPLAPALHTHRPALARHRAVPVGGGTRPGARQPGPRLHPGADSRDPLLSRLRGAAPVPAGTRTHARRALSSGTSARRRSAWWAPASRRR